MKGIRQLADHLQISIGTVSRALNDRPDVNPVTRQRVLEAAAELGYVPNHSGRSLRKGATGVIGVMLDHAETRSSGGESFFASLIVGLQKALGAKGLDVVAVPCPEGEAPDVFLQRMVGRRIFDGVVITSTRYHDPRFTFLDKSGVPFVALGRSADASAASRWLDLDFEGIASMAVKRLAERGHKRIAVAVPDTDINLGVLFASGYRAGLVVCGLEFDPALVIRAPADEEGGYQVAEELLTFDPLPTAIVLNAEMMSVGLYRKLIEVGLQPGRDLAVIAERESAVGRFLHPRLTCFGLDLEALGQSLGEMLLAEMPDFASAYSTAPHQQIWPLNLLSGESDPALV